MKITILLPDLRGGGAERVSVDLAHEFARLGHQVDFVLMRAEGEYLELIDPGIRVVDLAATRIRQVPHKLARYLKERRPDALIANMWPLTTAAVVGRWLSGRHPSLLLVEHAMLSQQYRNWGPMHRIALSLGQRLAVLGADAVAGVSRGVADDIARLSGSSGQHIKVLHNPIRRPNVPQIAELGNADAFWGAGSARRILTVGNLKEVKNHVLLLQAVARLPAGSVRLMLLGQGQNEAPLRRLAAELGIAEHVVFAGFQPDPGPFYATADLFVLSSDHEGFGNVIVEALASGLPVVSTDCPSGPAEILENGRYGRLTPVGDAAALARAMAEALQETPDRDALKRRAADFAPEKAARAYLEAMGLA